MRKFLLLLFCLGASSALLKPFLPEIDRIRLAEAFRIADTLGNKVWKNWDQAPFAVLLVTPDFEYLIRHPNPSDDFRLLHYDPLLKSKVFYRARTQRTDFLATFPAVGGVWTIVIGQAENTTAKTSTPWVVTVLHEHFHQLQASQADYYQQVEALDLSGGDQTGMWMLNHPFPYDSSEVQGQFSHLGQQLNENLKPETPVLSEKVAAYLRDRKAFQSMLTGPDYKYFSFQLWQEGVARYTEFKVALLAAAEYKPTEEFRHLKDYTSFNLVAEDLFDKVLDELKSFDLKEDRRVCFYAFGAGEGFLLDQVNPDWHDSYFKEKFFLEKYFPRRSP